MANTGWISNPNSHSYIEFESINGSSTCESNKITFHEIQGDDSNGYPAEVAVNIDDRLIDYGTITKVTIKYKAQGTNNWQRGTCRTGYLNSSDSKTWSNTHKEGVAQRSESAKSWEDNISNPTRSKNGKYRMLIGMQNYQWLTKLTVYISEIQIYIEYTPHTHNWTSTGKTNPTCTETGSESFKCSICGATKTETLSAKGHTEVTIPAVAATCTATGLTAGKKCSVCGTVTVAQTTVAKNPSNHTGSQVTLSAVAPTCEATGLTEGKKWSCCNAIITAQQTVPKLGHNYVGAVTKQPTCTEKGVKTYTCQNDASHKYTEEIPATGHTSGAAVIENRVEATCTASGSYDEVVYCTVCGAELSRTKVTVPAKGHSYTTHTFEPTETSAGYTRYTCSVCGYSYDTDYTYRLKIIVENGTVSGVVDGGIYAKGSKVNFTAIPDEGYEYRSAVVYYPDGSIRSFPYNTGRLEFIDNITFVVKFKSILPEITAVTITRSSDLAKVTINTPVDAGAKYIISVEVT